jgi:hypothetical protein
MQRTFRVLASPRPSAGVDTKTASLEPMALASASGPGQSGSLRLFLASCVALILVTSMLMVYRQRALVEPSQR